MFADLAWQAGEASDGCVGACSMIIHFLKLGIRYVLLIQRHVMLAPPASA